MIMRPAYSQSTIDHEALSGVPLAMASSGTLKTATNTEIANICGLQYTVYSDLKGLENIYGQWDQLILSSCCNRAFASVEWYVASCIKQKTWTPYLVTAARDGKLMCVLPLVIDKTDGTALFPHYGAGADYHDAIACNDSPAVVAASLKYALSFPGQCRRMVLSRLRPDSHCVKAMPCIQQDSDIQWNRRITNMYPHITLPTSFDEYLASRSKAFRKNIRRILRNIQKDGLKIQELRPGEFNPDDLPDLLTRMSVARTKEKSSFVRNAFIGSFLSAVLPAIFRRGHLRAFAIFNHGQIIALDLCMLCANGFVTWNGGFLAEGASWCPGSALFAHGIQEAIEMGLGEYDFTRGNEGYKASWATGSYPVSEIELTWRAPHASR